MAATNCSVSMVGTGFVVVCELRAFLEINFWLVRASCGNSTSVTLDDCPHDTNRAFENVFF